MGVFFIVLVDENWEQFLSIFSRSKLITFYKIRMSHECEVLSFTPAISVSTVKKIKTPTPTVSMIYLNCLNITLKKQTNKQTKKKTG